MLVSVATIEIITAQVGMLLSPEEIPLQPLRSRAQPGPERSAAGDVDRDHGEVDGIHFGARLGYSCSRRLAYHST